MLQGPEGSCSASKGGCTYYTEAPINKRKLQPGSQRLHKRPFHEWKKSNRGPGHSYHCWSTWDACRHSRDQTTWIRAYDERCDVVPHHGNSALAQWTLISKQFAEAAGAEKMQYSYALECRRNHLWHTEKEARANKMRFDVLNPTDGHGMVKELTW
jgi:hypothetical protein